MTTSTIDAAAPATTSTSAAHASGTWFRDCRGTWQLVTTTDDRQVTTC